MKLKFQGWPMVASKLKKTADQQRAIARAKGEAEARLNEGQRASLYAIANKIEKNGLVIADEVGMGKTRIAVEVIRCVAEAGGRAAVLLPPGLGYQWQAELVDGGLADVSPMLRGLNTYLEAWNGEEQNPWFEKSILLVSHVFANWQIRKNATDWRFTLLPEIYARWREKNGSRLPRGYWRQNCDDRVINAAASIVDSIPINAKQSSQRFLESLEANLPWEKALYEASKYSKESFLREGVERCVGLGFGEFELVVIDEAHKNRGEDSGLARLINKIIFPSDDVRRLAITATPVELDINQWEQALIRVGVGSAELDAIKPAIESYAKAVKQVRRSWRENSVARSEYFESAQEFYCKLSPYLIRRDKREETVVKSFQLKTGLPINAYRRESEIIVETKQLSPEWKQAVCAAEALSLVSRHADSGVIKRLRLTIGNGHGIVSLLDQIRHDENVDPEAEPQLGQSHRQLSVDAESKKDERMQWWLGVVEQAFQSHAGSLFEHPAILKAVEEIEGENERDEKVLVFGRFIRPLRALVDLLNARAMLRCLANGIPWPQSKVHGEKNGSAENSQWPAVYAALKQLNLSKDEAEIDRELGEQYRQQKQARQRFREQLLRNIETGFHELEPSQHVVAMFAALKSAVESSVAEDEEKGDLLTLVSRGMAELLGGDYSEPASKDCADAFCSLIEALTDKDEADTNQDGQTDEAEAEAFLDLVEKRLKDEYSGQQGGFARLMFSKTKLASRRIVQLAFNRKNSFPRVLVAQSLVGREGLNLHKACRIVMILHPEWNPGTVEQQIGRVDRVGSHWCTSFEKAADENVPADELPRIEVRPVIFRGTYDEYNWQVLRERWNDLRAQLHGVIIPEIDEVSDLDYLEVAKQISDAAPNFSPTRNVWDGVE